MTELLQPQPGDSIYDPTCGSGGMLLSCIAHLRRQGQEWRNVRLYGQERNLMTSAIARMNCFLHGIEDFHIERGDTLAEPKFVEGDRLMRFDLVLANPPYSIKQWDRDAFASDPWGRNLYGTPPQGRADYAFWQHILQSLAPKTGRCAILFPHGVLFRQEEADMRRKLIEADVIECVLGLEPNLFYNSPMEACVVICRTAKSKERRHKILLINAVNEVTRERAQSFLTDGHIERIVNAYEAFTDEPGFARVVGLEEIRAKDGNLSIPLYVSARDSNEQVQILANDSLPDSLSAWLSSVSDVRAALASILGANALKEMRALDGKPAQTLPAWIKRDEWKRLPFGAFAESINDRVEPSQVGDEIYVGLEHLDTQDLHIRRRGKGSDVIGTKLRFKKGDLIFGRRRAYQRKLAVAEFDGICSAHAMVVRVKPDVVLPEFLPFLMMSDRFMNRAVEISVGSLSPTINWSTLKREEFVLPPLEQQRRIAEILWAVGEVSERFQEIKAASDAATVSIRRHHFENALKECAVSSIAEVGRWSSGKTPSRDRRDLWSGDFPWISPKDMKTDFIADAEEHISEEGRKASIEVGAGALLIVVRGMILTHSLPVGITQRSMSFNQDMKALTPYDTYSVDYLFNWFKWATLTLLARISDSSHGTKRLSMDDLFSMKIPKLPLAEQLKVVNQINELEAAKSATNRNVEALATIHTVFLNTIVKG
jgi:type I restriction enzyme M protein